MKKNLKDKEIEEEHKEEKAPKEEIKQYKEIIKKQKSTHNENSEEVNKASTGVLKDMNSEMSTINKNISITTEQGPEEPYNNECLMNGRENIRKETINILNEEKKQISNETYDNSIIIKSKTYFKDKLVLDCTSSIGLMEDIKYQNEKTEIVLKDHEISKHIGSMYTYTMKFFNNNITKTK